MGVATLAHGAQPPTEGGRGRSGIFTRAARGNACLRVYLYIENIILGAAAAAKYTKLSEIMCTLGQADSDLPQRTARGGAAIIIIISAVIMVIMAIIISIDCSATVISR